MNKLEEQEEKANKTIYVTVPIDIFGICLSLQHNFHAK